MGPRGGDHGGEFEAMIEALLELGEVATHVLLADGAVGAGDRAFDVTEHRADPAEGGMTRRATAGARGDRNMHAAGVGDATKAGEAVGDDGRARRDDALVRLFTRRRLKRAMRRSLIRRGRPFSSVSTATTISFLLGHPRPLLPPERSPPR